MRSRWDAGERDGPAHLRRRSALYTRCMTVDRVELHQLVDELPDDQVSSLLVEARRRANKRRQGTWPPAFFGFGPAVDGRTDTSERIDEILAEGFGQA